MTNSKEDSIHNVPITDSDQKASTDDCQQDPNKHPATLTNFDCVREINTNAASGDRNNLTTTVADNFPWERPILMLKSSLNEEVSTSDASSCTGPVTAASCQAMSANDTFCEEDRNNTDDRGSADTIKSELRLYNQTSNCPNGRTSSGEGFTKVTMSMASSEHVIKNQTSNCSKHEVETKLTMELNSERSGEMIATDGRPGKKPLSIQFPATRPLLAAEVDAIQVGSAVITHMMNDKVTDLESETNDKPNLDQKIDEGLTHGEAKLCDVCTLEATDVSSNERNQVLPKECDQPHKDCKPRDTNTLEVTLAPDGSQLELRDSVADDKDPPDKEETATSESLAKPYSELEKFTGIEVQDKESPYDAVSSELHLKSNGDSFQTSSEFKKTTPKTAFADRSNMSDQSREKPLRLTSLSIQPSTITTQTVKEVSENNDSSVHSASGVESPTLLCGKKEEHTEKFESQTSSQETDSPKEKSESIATAKPSFEHSQEINKLGEDGNESVAIPEAETTLSSHNIISVLPSKDQSDHAAVKGSKPLSKGNSVASDREVVVTAKEKPDLLDAIMPQIEGQGKDVPRITVPLLGVKANSALACPNSLDCTLHLEQGTCQPVT